MNEREVRYVQLGDMEKLEDALTAEAKQGSLTPQRLEEAVLTLWASNDTSVGARWIKQNPDLFERAIVFPEQFLRNQFDNEWYYLIELMSRAEVLRTIPQDRRTGFVRDAYLKYGAYPSWVKAALDVGVHQKDIAAMILERLEIASTDSRGGPRDFLREGHGLHEASPLLTAEWRREELRKPFEPEIIRNDHLYRQIRVDNGEALQIWHFSEEMPWGVLTEEELERALRMCALRAPVEVLALRGKIAIALGVVRAAKIADEAAEHVDSLAHLTKAGLASLSRENRLAMARRLKPFERPHLHTESQANTIEFFLDLMLEMSRQGAEELYRETERVWKSVSPVVLARTVAWVLFAKEHPRYAVEKTEFDLPKPGGEWSWLWQHVESCLRAGGYFIGVVTEGSHTPRGHTRPMRQYQVVSGNVTFVQDRYQHRYFPRAGDLVIIHPEGTSFLTRRGAMEIRAAGFTPVDRRQNSE